MVHLPTLGRVNLYGNCIIGKYTIHGSYGIYIYTMGPKNLHIRGFYGK